MPVTHKVSPPFDYTSNTPHCLLPLLSSSSHEFRGIQIKLTYFILEEPITLQLDDTQNLEIQCWYTAKQICTEHRQTYTIMTTKVDVS